MARSKVVPDREGPTMKTGLRLGEILDTENWIIRIQGSHPSEVLSASAQRSSPQAQPQGEIYAYLETHEWYHRAKVAIPRGRLQ